MSIPRIQSLDVAEEQDINYSALRDDDWVSSRTHYLRLQQLLLHLHASLAY